MPIVPNHHSGGPPTRKVREVLSVQSFELNRPGTKMDVSDQPSVDISSPLAPVPAPAPAPPPSVPQMQAQPQPLNRTAPSIHLQDDQNDGPGTYVPEQKTEYQIPARHALPSPTEYASQGAQKPVTETDADVDSVDLPSLGQFYPYTTLPVSPLKGRTIAKFHRAYLEQRLRFTVEAISSTLEGVSAFTLTPGDFYYLMYWHKARNLKNSSSLVTGFCKDANHIAQVKAGKKTADTLKIEQILTRSTLDVKNLSVIDMNKWRAKLPSYTLGVETMQDVVDSSEAVQAMIEEATTADGVDSVKDRSTEFIWLAERAGYVIPQGDDKSFAAKLQLIEEMDSADIAILDEYIEEVTAYGVSEFANLRCKDCSALTRVKLSFDALCFLPSS